MRKSSTLWSSAHLTCGIWKPHQTRTNPSSWTCGTWKLITCAYEPMERMKTRPRVCVYKSSTSDLWNVKTTSVRTNECAYEPCTSDLWNVAKRLGVCVRIHHIYLAKREERPGVCVRIHHIYLVKRGKRPGVCVRILHIGLVKKQQRVYVRTCLSETNTFESALENKTPTLSGLSYYVKMTPITIQTYASHIQHPNGKVLSFNLNYGSVCIKQDCDSKTVSNLFRANFRAIHP